MHILSGVCPCRIEIGLKSCKWHTKKKARVSFEELDLAKGLLSWKKLELVAYLSHYNITKSGNKSELIRHVEAHMFTVKLDNFSMPAHALINCFSPIHTGHS